MSSAPVERCKLFHIRTCFTLGLVTIVRMSSAWAPRLPSEKDILTNPGSTVVEEWSLRKCCPPLEMLAGALPRLPLSPLRALAGSWGVGPHRSPPPLPYLTTSSPPAYR